MIDFTHPGTSVSLHDLRYQVAPLEVLRNTLRSRFERGHVRAPDCQFAAPTSPKPAASTPTDLGGGLTPA